MSGNTVVVEEESNIERGGKDNHLNRASLQNSPITNDLKSLRARVDVAVVKVSYTPVRGELD